MRDDAQEVGFGGAGGVGAIARGFEFGDQFGLATVDGFQIAVLHLGDGHLDQQGQRQNRDHADDHPKAGRAPQLCEQQHHDHRIGRRRDQGLAGRGAHLGENQHITGHEKRHAQRHAIGPAVKEGEQRRRRPGDAGNGGGRQLDPAVQLLISDHQDPFGERAQQA
ncbi:hypothetical protein HF680_10070 [Brevundimonas sp. WCHBH090558]|uniref:hypothetical protein n=1 Tax=Brevundimonas huaxiensis TaxID=2725493 RepID=UPI00162451B5|nr:hypothetical protein [Brevundimonas huaxiensis]MBC1182997.1 hypothetical protein [Brevundimonas huaxiensis]